MSYLKQVNTGGIVSTANSSTTPLNTATTFTGTGELNEHSDVMVQVTTDQNGTLYMEFSPDGTNWDTSLTFYYDTSRINPPHVLVKGYRYYRTRFTNTSSSNQTYLRLDTYFGGFQKLTAPINGTLAENYDAIVTRPTDYTSEVAMGKRQGRTTVNKWGVNTDVDTASAEIVASFGGAFDPTTDIITTAQTFTIAYDTAIDGLGNTGALSLLITYIDADFISQTAVHTLSNTGSDVTAFSGLGINRALVYSTGGDPYNGNNITITATTDTTTQAQIPQYAGVTQQAYYHTQINHTLLTDWLFLNALKDTGGGGSPKVIFRIYSFSRVTSVRYKVFECRLDTSSQETLELTPSQKFPFGGREVIWIEAETSVNNTSVSARFSGIETRVQ